MEPWLALRVEGDTAADHHRMDHGAELVDQTQLGGLAGESGATDPAVAASRLPPQALDLLDQAAGGDPGIPPHGRQRCREHDLREGPPYRSPLEGVEVQRRILVGRLPVQHRLVKPSTQHMRGKLPRLIGPEAKDLLVGRRPVEAAVRARDVSVERDAHRVDHAAHQRFLLGIGSTLREGCTVRVRNHARACVGPQPICSASPMRMPSGPRTYQSRYASSYWTTSPTSGAPCL